MHFAHTDVHSWLVTSRGWTPLHHIEAICDSYNARSTGARRRWNGTSTETMEKGLISSDCHHPYMEPVQVLRPERTAALLRAGASIHATADDGATPLALARVLHKEGRAEMGSAPELVLRSAEPWSPQNHRLFPEQVPMICLLCAESPLLTYASPLFCVHSLSLSLSIY